KAFLPHRLEHEPQVPRARGSHRGGLTSRCGTRRVLVLRTSPAIGQSGDSLGGPLNDVNPGRRRFDDRGQRIPRLLPARSYPCCCCGHSLGGITPPVVERVMRMAKMELLRKPPKCFRVAQEEKSTR